MANKKFFKSNMPNKEEEIIIAKHEETSPINEHSTSKNEGGR